MIVISDYRDKGKNNTIWGYFDGRHYETIEPEEMAIRIGEILNRKETGGQYVYITNMSLYLESLIKTLWINGYTPIAGNPAVKDMKNKQYKYLVNGEFTAYSITVRIHKRGVYMVNADNILTFSDRDRVIDTWGLGECDGDMARQYCLATYRGIKEIITDSGAVKNLPVTISGCARKRWKSLFSDGAIKDILMDANELQAGTETAEEYCRRAYHGGLCIMRGEATTAEEIGEGVVLDINSLYPYVMRTRPMPYGLPHWGSGEIPENIKRDAEKGYIYYYVRVKVILDGLKQNGIPCICMAGKDKDRYMFKKGWLENSRAYNWAENKYIGKPREIEITLTQTDYKLMLENYNISSIKYVSYMWQPATTSLFDRYIDHYYNKKKTARNGGERQVAKMMLNGLSGNMARMPLYTNLIISVDQYGNIDMDKGITNGGLSYVYVGGAITSYAREILINYGKKCGKRWIYSDTDSLHLKGRDIPDFIPIGDKMGEFKIEKEFDSAIYYKQKMYGFKKDGRAHLTLAGIPQHSVKLIENIIDNIENPYNGTDCIDPHGAKAMPDKLAEAYEGMFRGDADEGEQETIKYYERLDAKKQKAYENFLKDIKTQGMRGLLYTTYPITLRREGDMWSEELYNSYGSLADTKNIF